MPTRRTEDFGDFIGSYNFTVQIDAAAAAPKLQEAISNGTVFPKVEIN